MDHADSYSGHSYLKGVGGSRLKMEPHVNKSSIWTINHVVYGKRCFVNKQPPAPTLANKQKWLDTVAQVFTLTLRPIGIIIDRYMIILVFRMTSSWLRTCPRFASAKLKKVKIAGKIPFHTALKHDYFFGLLFVV